MAARTLALALVSACVMGTAVSDTVVRLGGQVSTIAPEFISFTTDISRLHALFKNYNTTDPRLKALMHSLKPAVLRVGGTAEDYATYFSAGKALGGDSGAQWTITTEMADMLCAYATMSEWLFVLGLNSQPGYNSSASHAWDDSNARKLLSYIASTGCPVSGFELGNELNIGANQPGKGAFTGQLQGSHFNTLTSKTLPAFYSSLGKGTPASPLVIGPDTTQSGITPAAAGDEAFLDDFLSSFGPSDYGVDRVTWHQYQKPAHTLDWYLEPENLDVIMGLAMGANASFARYAGRRVASGGASPQLWLGETGIELNSPLEPNGPAGQHVPGLDDGFAGVLAFADKLGLAMRFGHSVVVQQQLPNLVVEGPDPSTGALSVRAAVPSLFLSALWKQVAGSAVLSVGGDTAAGRSLRVYAVCAAAPNAGSAAVFVINVNASAAESVSFASSATGEALIPSSMFDLAPYPDAHNVSAPAMAINGKLATLSESGAIPTAAAAPAPAVISVAARTMAVVLVKGVDACT